MIRLCLYWATFTAMWVIIMVEVRLMLRSRRTLTEGAQHRAFAQWGQWMTLSVTDRTGLIYATTLHGLYEERVTEKVWTDPIAISLWQSDPCLHDRYQRDAAALLERPETDCE